MRRERSQQVIASQPWFNVRGGERTKKSRGTKSSAVGAIGWKHIDRRSIYTSSEKLLGFFCLINARMNGSLMRADLKSFPKEYPPQDPSIQASPPIARRLLGSPVTIPRILVAHSVSHLMP